MAAKTPTTLVEFSNKTRYTWSGITNADTGGAVAVQGGKYAFNVEAADFDSCTLEFEFSVDDTNYHSLQTTMTFAASGTKVLEIPAGNVRITNTGGGTTNLSAVASLIPIPNETT